MAGELRAGESRVSGDGIVGELTAQLASEPAGDLITTPLGYPRKGVVFNLDE